MIDWEELNNSAEGELHRDEPTLMAYSTDASVYRFRPDAVLFPKNAKDLVQAVHFAKKNHLSIIPRGAGTSLAGQCVGGGLVVDTSRYMNEILEVNIEKGYVDVEPGVIRDKLNLELKHLGYWFSPNTSTASRCVIGGMVGNNSCGSTSIKYGTTRDKLIELDVILHDGSEVKIGEAGAPFSFGSDMEAAMTVLETRIIELLQPVSVQEEIRLHFPKASVKRRNTGYALDELIEMQPFKPNGPPFNLAKIIAGSEGTLCLISRVRLKIDPLPPPHDAVIAIHFDTLQAAMLGAVLAMKFEPYACELVDRTILELTKTNPEQAENRFFVEGDPAAILAVELRADDEIGLGQIVGRMTAAFLAEGLGSAFPVLTGSDIEKVWALRQAGLGILSNMPGDAKPIAFVEDTAVALEDLPNYINDFEQLMQGFGQQAVYYAHAGAGELHLRPILDLKTNKDRQTFRAIGEASSDLVKKYRGSLSGEHGDGRVRGEFIAKMVGQKNYELFKVIKDLFDPGHIFNPGKIVDAAPMDADLRYKAQQEPMAFKTFLNFGDENMLQSAERCNGSGDCRKEAWTGVAMCPSYQATRNELDSTRARANVLREVMTNPINPAYPLDSPALPAVLDLCLSCKACKRECPSNVDISALKAEAMYQIQRRNGTSLATKFFGNFHKIAQLAQPFALITNPIQRISAIDRQIKSRLGIATQRSIPPFALKKATIALRKYETKGDNLDFILYIDEFSQYQDTRPAIDAAKLFKALGYKFRAVYAPSGRASFSKSLLEEAKTCAELCILRTEAFVSRSIPIVGVEPSAIIGFRDEFLRLFSGDMQVKAQRLADLSLTFEEFMHREFEAKRIRPEQFTDRAEEVHVHLHCHQRALSHVKYSKLALGIPKNYKVRVIASGCCGMAGSFGYEAEKYELSQSIGNLNLFPHLRKFTEVKVVASGTSCRHQIHDALKRETLHPASLLLHAVVANAKQ